MAKTTISKLQRFVEGFQEQDFHIGVDVHKRSYHVALRRSDGKTITFVTLPDPHGLVLQLEHLNVRVASLCYESGPTGFTLARTVRNAGIKALVAAPSRIPRAILAGAKTDRLDCIRLADYAARGLIKSIMIPSEKEEGQRSLIRRRHQLVDSIRRSKQRIKGLLLYLGIAEPPEINRWRQGAIEALLSVPIEPEARRTLTSHLRELTFLQEELSEVESNIAELSAQEEHRRTLSCLQSVPGVGKVVSTTFRMELFRPERFTRAEEVTSYLGLAPMVHHSGEKTPSGHLRPVGQARLRSLLIEAAWTWQARDPYAKGLYNRFLGRMGISQKAIAAVARKLAIILWRLSIEKRAYRPLGV
jgi:transposase